MTNNTATPYKRFTDEQIEQLKTAHAKHGAEYILKAVNSHEKLVECLKADLRVFKNLATETNDAAIKRSIYDIEQALKSAGEI